MSARLLLDPDPQSVRRARVWIGEELERLGRPDLVDSAELGISELVTNAILHADPPITVRLKLLNFRPFCLTCFGNRYFFAMLSFSSSV